MKRLFLMGWLCGTGLALHAAEQPALWVAYGDHDGVVAPFTVWQNDQWERVNPASLPSLWTVVKHDGTSFIAHAQAPEKGNYGLLTDQERGIDNLLVFSTPVVAGYFQPLPEAKSTLQELTAAVAGKGPGAWSFQTLSVNAPGWTVYGYRVVNVGKDVTQADFGLLTKHGAGPLMATELGDTWAGEGKDAVTGGLMGAFVWENALFVVSEQSQEGSRELKIWRVGEPVENEFEGGSPVL